jgi:DNA-binding transcriptional MocR family regulator
MDMKYTKIMDVIQERMSSGKLGTGNKLPSIRQLSEQFNCSKNTIIRAFNELEKQHFIYSVPKSGYYVVNKSQSTKSDSIKNKIDFLSAGPDKVAMPYLDFQHCLNKAIDLYKEELFNYSDQQGFYSLRLQLIKHLQDLQVFTVPERLFIVSGSQQALNLLVSMPFPNGKTNILLEQPTYFGFVDSVQLHNTTTFGIERTMDGIDLNQLEFIFRNNQIKFFYTVPRFHNPLGHSYTNEQKKKIVELAQQYDVYIVEDDYLGSLDQNPKSDPMFAYDPSGRVIYIKSFSKVMLPGLRLGIAVLPHLMVSTFLRYKFNADFNSSALSQGALEIYLKSGMFHAHIKRIRELYQRKMKLLQDACEQLLSADTFYSKPSSGFYLTVYLPEQIKAKQMVHLLSQENIFVDDAVRMFLPEYRKENMLRLSISQVEENLIKQGVEQISRYIKFFREKTGVYIQSPSSLL